MDVREKLIEILRKPIFPHELVDPTEAVADYLLDSGVTVQKWIVDAVEVVRCRECKYHEDTDVTGFKHCCLIDKTVRYNDFCSYGKRKGGSDNG